MIVETCDGDDDGCGGGGYTIGDGIGKGVGRGCAGRETVGVVGEVGVAAITGDG